jgi:hypothetical protein
VKAIPLTKGYEATVDEADYAILSRFNWCYSDGYAIRGVRDRRAGTQATIRMHRVILDAPEGIEVDHVNGNRLDNRRANLRLATHKQNLHNLPTPAHNTSGFKGVSWCKRSQKWRAYIKVDGKSKHLGLFATAEGAALAYDEAALLYFGSFARTNS